jgi:hypothetical protein
MKWTRITLLIIGTLVTLLAVLGVLMWSVSGQGELVALSVVFLIVGLVIVIYALMGPSIWKILGLS